MRSRVYWTKEDRELIAALDEVEDFLRSPKPVLDQFAKYTKQQHIKAFKGRYDPATGRPWKPLAASTIAQKQAGKKRKGKSLASTLFVEVEKSGVVVGYRSPIAAIQHRGAKIPAHTVIPRNKQALYWVGASHPVARVTIPAYQIPARPLVGFSPIDIARLRTMTVEEIKKRWEQ
jgi:phage gpG-like protein